MKKYNRILVLALCITLFISLCIACSNKGAKASSGKTTQEVTGANKTSEGQEPLTLPIVKEPLTLTYFLPLDVKAAALIKSYNEMSAYQEAEKRTGIHIEFQHPPAGQETEQFNLMVASASLTDIVGWDWFRVSGGPAKVLEDGSIIKLNDLIEKYAPNLKKLLNNNPEARKAVMLDDGTFFMFPNLILEPGKQPTDGFQIRKDWLDREGLQIPATIDEWYTALKAIKEKDVNGNGKPNDEIPFLSKKSADFKYFSGAWGIDAVNGFYQINGKVKYTPLEPQYKDYIRTMAKWYKEGLIDPEYASVDTKNFDAKVTGNRGGAYYGL